MQVDIFSRRLLSLSSRDRKVESDPTINFTALSIPPDHPAPDMQDTILSVHDCDPELRNANQPSTGFRIPPPIESNASQAGSADIRRLPGRVFHRRDAGLEMSPPTRTVWCASARWRVLRLD